MPGRISDDWLDRWGRLRPSWMRHRRLLRRVRKRGQPVGLRAEWHRGWFRLVLRPKKGFIHWSTRDERRRAARDNKQYHISIANEQELFSLRDRDPQKFSIFTRGIQDIGGHFRFEVDVTLRIQSVHFYAQQMYIDHDDPTLFMYMDIIRWMRAEIGYHDERGMPWFLTPSLNVSM